MTDMIKVTQELKFLIYGPTCSTQSPEDRAIAIESNLDDVFATLAELGDGRDEIEEAQDAQATAEGALADVREIMAELVAAIEDLKIGDKLHGEHARVGELLIVAHEETFMTEQRDRLKKALAAAKLESDGGL